MPVKQALKSRALDDLDRQILNILQDDGRVSLTNISKKVLISIDSVNNRIQDMQRKGIFSFGIYVEPDRIGYPLIAEVKVKLQNISVGEKAKFIGYLKAFPQVIELFSILGDFDLTCVMIAKDTREMESLATQIRQKHAHIIADWVSVLVLENHKFESYDMQHL